jgi:hypothetical protein
MEDLRKVRCRRCNEFYTFAQGLPPELCPTCADEKETQVKQIRELIRENRGICAMELEKMSGIPIALILESIDNENITEKKETPLPTERGRFYL